MFKRVVLENFKSFKYIDFNLAGAHGIPKKFAFIYGENGAGKSNLISSFVFLHDSMLTLKSMKALDLLKEKAKVDDVLDIDVDNFSYREAMNLMFSVQHNRDSLQKLAQSSRMIDSDAGIKVRYEIVRNGSNGYYEIEFDENNNLLSEKLYCLINNRVGTIFELHVDNDDALRGFEIKLSPHCFQDKSYQIQFENLLEQYWGKHTLLAIMIDQMAQNNKKFMKNRVNSNVLDIVNFFNTFTVNCNLDKTSKIHYNGVSNRILASLSDGEIAISKKAELLVFEEALNDFFTRAYSDIKKVYYKFGKKKNNNVEYELFFKKQIEGKIRDISVKYESSGTLKLLDNFPAFYECARGHVALLDEIDSGIHDLLMSHIIQELYDSFTGQFITTTHNTLLLKSIPPDNAYIIRIDFNGKKSIQTIKELDATQKNHNNQDRYLAGLFDGTPIMDSLDFSNIVSRSVRQLGED